MVKNQIQEQRMKTYFIEATKEILKAEGLRTISVRNIAEKAGYSYATLYNYFKDAKDLVFECVKDFHEEIREFIKAQLKKEKAGVERINAIAIAYLKYFMEYPGIFELFYMEKPHEMATKQPTLERIRKFPIELCAKDWEMCLTEGIFTEQEVEDKQDQMNYLLSGMMLFFFYRTYPNDYKEFLEKADEQIKQMLGK